MNRPAHTTPAELPEPTICMAEGWHCLHLYYSVNQDSLLRIDASQRDAGRQQLAEILDPERDGAPQRIQTSLISGHKAVGLFERAEIVNFAIHERPTVYAHQFAQLFLDQTARR